MIEYTIFRRCRACGRAFEVQEALKKGRVRCKCGGGQFIPARLSILELTWYCVTHPAVLWETIWAKFTE